MAKEKLVIVIDGDSKGAVKAAKTAGSSISKLGKLVGGLALAGGALFLAKKGFDALSGAIRGTANFLKGSISVAADFEKSMRNVNSIMGLSEKEFRATSEAVVEIAKTLPQSSQVLSEGLYDIASAGFAGADGLKVLEASAKAASAGLTDTKVSAKGITAVLNAYGFEAKDATKVSDIMFTTVKKGVTTFEKLSSNLGKILSTGKAARISFAQLSGALAFLTTKGVSTEESVTSLNQLILSFIKPTKEMTKELNEAGFATGELLLEEEGLAGAMEFLGDATEGSITKMTEMLSSVEAVKSAAALLGGGFDELDRFMQDFNDTSGATAEALDEQSKSYAFQLDILKTRFLDVKKAIGDAFLPVLIEVMGKISESGGLFDNLSGVVESVAGNLGKWLDLNWDKLEGFIDIMMAADYTAISAGIQNIGEAFGFMIGNETEGAIGAEEAYQNFIDGIGEGMTTLSEAIIGMQLFMKSLGIVLNLLSGISIAVNFLSGMGLFFISLGQEGQREFELMDEGIEKLKDTMTTDMAELTLLTEKYHETIAQNAIESTSKVESEFAGMTNAVIENFIEMKVGAENFQNFINSMHGADISSTHTITTIERSAIGLMAGPRQSGGIVARDQFATDLQIPLVKGEAVLPAPLVKAIKEGQGSFAGVDAGGGGGDTTINFIGAIVREDNDFNRIADEVSKVIHNEQLREQRGGGFR